MIRFRSFRNDDPPALCRIWREHGQIQSDGPEVSATMLEEHVFSKLYFRREGLIVAIDPQDKPVGFVHAGFGPSDDRSSVGTSLGVVANVVVGQYSDRFRCGVELIAQGENYLRGRGANSIVAMGTTVVCPYYLGLYGGSQVSGLMSTDKFRLDLFRVAGYLEIGRYSVQQIEPAKFRPVTDRLTIQWRRQFELESEVDDAPKHWWDACVLGNAHVVRYGLVSDRGERPPVTLSAWDMSPMAALRRASLRGVLSTTMGEGPDSLALLQYLIGEVLRRFGSDNVILAEAKYLTSEIGLASIYKRLGFKEVNQGIVLEKTLR